MSCSVAWIEKALPFDCITEDAQVGGNPGPDRIIAELLPMKITVQGFQLPLDPHPGDGSKSPAQGCRNTKQWMF